MFERAALFTVSTPWEKVPKVTLFADTWYKHIVIQHVQMLDRQDDVRTIVSEPTVILSGTSNPAYVMYVNHAITAFGGTPIAVIVNPEAQIICTAYPNRSLRVVSKERILWSSSVRR